MARRERLDAESRRLAEDARRTKNWKRWGPYLSERQWGTVREDYSPDGTCWDYFPHEHARSRAYRWARMACWESAIVSAASASPSRSGTGATRFSRSGSLASPGRKATTART